MSEGGSNKYSNLMNAIAELKKNQEAYCEIFAITAKLMKARYDLLIESGFTAEQALEIVKTKGWTI